MIEVSCDITAARLGRQSGGRLFGRVLGDSP